MPRLGEGQTREQGSFASGDAPTSAPDAEPLPFPTAAWPPPRM